MAAGSYPKRKLQQLRNENPLLADDTPALTPIPNVGYRYNSATTAAEGVQQQSNHPPPEVDPYELPVVEYLDLVQLVSILWIPTLLKIGTKWKQKKDASYVEEEDNNSKKDGPFVRLHERIQSYFGWSLDESNLEPPDNLLHDVLQEFWADLYSSGFFKDTREPTNQATSSSPPPASDSSLTVPPNTAIRKVRPKRAFSLNVGSMISTNAAKASSETNPLFDDADVILLDDSQDPSDARIENAIEMEQHRTTSTSETNEIPMASISEYISNSSVDEGDLIRDYVTSTVTSNDINIGDGTNDSHNALKNNANILVNVQAKDTNSSMECPQVLSDTIFFDTKTIFEDQNMPVAQTNPNPSIQAIELDAVVPGTHGDRDPLILSHTDQVTPKELVGRNDRVGILSETGEMTNAIADALDNNLQESGFNNGQTAPFLESPALAENETARVEMQATQSNMLPTESVSIEMNEPVNRDGLSSLRLELKANVTSRLARWKSEPEMGASRWSSYQTDSRKDNDNGYHLLLPGCNKQEFFEHKSQMQLETGKDQNMSFSKKLSGPDQFTADESNDSNFSKGIFSPPLVTSDLVAALLLKNGENERAKDTKLIERMVQAAHSSSGRFDEEALVNALLSDVEDWGVNWEDQMSSYVFDIFGTEDLRDFERLELFRNERESSGSFINNDGIQTMHRVRKRGMASSIDSVMDSYASNATLIAIWSFYIVATLVYANLVRVANFYNLHCKPGAFWCTFEQTLFTW